MPVKRLNVETGQQEPIEPDKNNQVKKISKEKFKVWTRTRKNEPEPKVQKRLNNKLKVK